MIKFTRLSLGAIVFTVSYCGISNYSAYRVLANVVREHSNLKLKNNIVSKPPWEITPSDAKPLVLPPWGILSDSKDFVVTHQMPLSSGKREILLVSPSSKVEQRFLVNLPNSSGFEIYEISFNRVLVDANKLPSGNSQLTAAKAQQLLRNFTVKLSNNTLYEVILADGSKAEFKGNQAIIKLPDGQKLETFKLSQEYLNRQGINSLSNSLSPF